MSCGENKKNVFFSAAGCIGVGDVDDSDDEAKADDDSEESSSTKSNVSSDDVDVSMARPDGNHKDKDGNITGSEERENGAVSPRVYWEYALAAGGAKTVAVLMFMFARTRLRPGSRSCPSSLRMPMLIRICILML